MKSGIATREVLSLTVRGVCLRGTCHPGVVTGARIGVLIPNGGVMPRAGAADAAVFWADCLARRGYPVFRFDLPGLGDSDRDPAALGIDFQAHADSGGYGPWLSAIASELAGRYHLDGIVVLAHCSGATTAVFGAAANQSIRGIIVLDPYFEIQPEGDVQTLMLGLNKRVSVGLGGGWALPPVARKAAVSLISLARKAYHVLHSARVLVRRSKLPGNANLPLVRCWKQVASSGIPILILQSPAHARKTGAFDYLGYLQQGSRHARLTIDTVEGATHAFAERQSIARVAAVAEQWLATCFPVERGIEILTLERPVA